MNSTILVARRELQAQLRSKALVVSTIILAVLILAAGVLGRLLLSDDDGDDEPAATVGVSESAMPLADALSAAGLTTVPVDGDPQTILESEEELDALIAGAPDSPQIFALDSAEHLDLITSITQSATTAFIIGEQLGDAEATVVLDAIGQAQQIVPDIVGGTEFDPVRFVVGLLTATLVYGVIVFGIAMLATGVVEEKTSRVVEILLATIKPRNLLLGKFLGIGVAILSIVAIYVIALVAAGAISGLLPEINIGRYIPMLIVWVLLGYIIYASVTGGLAATVSRQEDIGAITGPMVFLSLIPFYFAMFYVPENPDSTVTQIVGFVPFFSPFVMPVRSAFTNVPAFDIVIAIAICLATIPLLAAIAGKIYERSILHTGTRMKLKDALRSRP
ncbi:ABC transporter permease [Flaviflexus huanghaiensis]|uniref:ABC transporter permease n=1 Tax=Flaviflexus huanghaiensis TaxID=1111473 RepID=UPI0015FD6FAE|nr:ABC transporter permease [Flaviflexus huanghaiensis]